MYKFHMRDLATRAKLVKMKILKDSTCIKCTKSTETIQHMFWECDLIHQLWSDLHTWLSKVYGHNITFSRESVMLYLFDEDIDSTMYYILILIYTLTKQMIYELKDESSVNYVQAVKVIN